MFMHAGFAMLETGSCRAKNASNVLMKILGAYRESRSVVKGPTEKFGGLGKLRFRAFRRCLGETRFGVTECGDSPESCLRHGFSTSYPWRTGRKPT